MSVRSRQLSDMDVEFGPPSRIARLPLCEGLKVVLPCHCFACYSERRDAVRCSPHGDDIPSIVRGKPIAETLFQFADLVESTIEAFASLYSGLDHDAISHPSPEYDAIKAGKSFRGIKIRNDPNAF